MKKLWVWILVVVVIGLVAIGFCAKAQAEEQTDMYGQAKWKASTGDLWYTLYRDILDEDDCSTDAVTIYVDADPYPLSYADATFGQTFTSYTPGALFSGTYDGPYAVCSGSWKYLLWSGSGEDLENALIDWVEGSASTFTFYVGRFAGTSMQTGQDCTTCITQHLWGYKTLKLGDDSQPYWEMPATAVTSGPSGCRPECELSEKPDGTGRDRIPPPLDPVGVQTSPWSTIKRLYR